MRGETNQTKASVGVIGLGALGRPVAERLLAHGFAVNVYDVRAEPVAALSGLGAMASTSPADVATRSDFIVSLVADASQTNEIVCGSGGILEAVRSGTTVVIGSTLDPAVVRRIAGMLAARGAQVLDAPISGGLVAAREGTLSLMIGGDQATLDQALPVLHAFARAITRAGDIGAGQTAKLAHQLVFSINVMGLLEGLALGVAGGVDPPVLKTILKEGIANSSVLQLWDELGPRWKGMLRPSEPGAMPPNMRKDLHLALQLAHELDVSLYVGTQASLIADAGVATGHDDPRL